MSQTQTLEIAEIPVDKIRPSPYQPRLDFDLEELRGSIIKYGIRDPLKIRQAEDHWELIDGERRWRIAKQEGIKTVPCLILKYTDEEADALSWRFNTERKQYTLEERAKHFRQHQKEGLSGAAIGRIHGYGHLQVSRLLAIFRLPDKYQNYMWTGEFAVQKYEYLYGKGLINGKSVSIETEVTKIIDEAIERRLTQREFENVIDDYFTDLEKRQVEEAKKVVTQLEVSKQREDKAREALGKPEVKEPETPEELERASEALKKEAEKRKTPEQRAEEKRQKLITQARKSLNSVVKKIDGALKIIDVGTFRKRLNELEKSLEQNPTEVKEQLITLGKEVIEAKKQCQKEVEEEKRKKREEEERRRLDEEMRRKLEEEKRRIAEEARKKAQEEIKKRIEAERKRIEQKAIEKAKDVFLEDKSLLREATQRYKELMASERLAKRKKIEEAVTWKVNEADLVHKIVIGDAGAILEKIDSPFVDLIVTSPPYFSLKEYPDSDFRIDAKSIDMYLKDLKTIFEECFRVMKDGRFLCVIVGQFTSGEKSYFIPAHITHLLEDIGFHYKREHIWVKPLGIQGIWNRGTTSFLNQPYPRNTMINIHHEHILVFQKGDKPEVFYGRNPLSVSEVKEWCWSVWELPVSHVKDHPAPFPETIVKRLIKMYSYEGEIVLDPFLGSGTTSKVAKILKRRSVGIEVSPEYLPLIKREVGGANIIRYDQNESVDFSLLKTELSTKSH